MSKLKVKIEATILSLFEDIGEGTETLNELKKLTIFYPDLREFYENLKNKLLPYCLETQQLIEEAKKPIEVSNWLDCQSKAVEIIGWIDLHAHCYNTGIFDGIVRG